MKKNLRLSEDAPADLADLSDLACRVGQKVHHRLGGYRLPSEIGSNLGRQVVFPGRRRLYRSDQLKMSGCEQELNEKATI